MLPRFLNNYFGFNKQQRNGLLVLLLISFVLLIIRLIYPYFIKPDDSMVLLDLPKLERKLDSNRAARMPEKPYLHGMQAQQLFVFDPNTATHEQLTQLGLKEKTAKALINFRNKGFVFRKKEDLLKVYGIPEQLYTRLVPYIQIPEVPKGSVVAEISKPTSAPETHVAETHLTSISKLELNSADSLSLIAVNGVGPSYARRILKYRSMLGGFVVLDQLKEIYGVNEETFEKIKPNFTVNSSGIKKINLNKDDFKSLNRHPYLSYELTKTIFSWRQKTLITAANLKDILNDAELYRKLLPYLSFD